MLNRIFILFSFLAIICVTNNAHAMRNNEVIQLKPKYVKIKPPFTSSGIVYLNIENTLGEDLTITKIHSPQAQYSKIYEQTFSRLGLPKKKEIKTVNIRALKTTAFAEKTFQIMLVGLDPDISPNQDLQVDITFKDLGIFSTYLPILFAIED
ncbi:MAG: copper chaperone PCu(A)C [Proteobacteria bacterium]|nr:copper chaperone PCu(A)C [Pseudomonadota bacterium]